MAKYCDNCKGDIEGQPGVCRACFGIERDDYQAEIDDLEEKVIFAEARGFSLNPFDQVRHEIRMAYLPHYRAFYAERQS